ncbi:hypothetical protein Y032_0031g2428 [Ancylostoma ceylanicum]|uniref:Uncharacterized protein n=1 Tax=Ancylostoma ceylanicum TaxID=53326 RepID=A0A016UR20_9BILA|nr:hypothetical protein Y032_0031g2428 [Ancylostoma ceylanicum]
MIKLFHFCVITEDKSLQTSIFELVCKLSLRDPCLQLAPEQYHPHKDFAGVSFFLAADVETVQVRPQHFAAPSLCVDRNFLCSNVKFDESATASIFI